MVVSFAGSISRGGASHLMRTRIRFTTITTYLFTSKRRRYAPFLPTFSQIKLPSRSMCYLTDTKSQIPPWMTSNSSSRRASPPRTLPGYERIPTPKPPTTFSRDHTSLDTLACRTSNATTICQLSFKRCYMFLRFEISCWPWMEAELLPLQNLRNHLQRPRNLPRRHPSQNRRRPNHPRSSSAASLVWPKKFGIHGCSSAKSVRTSSSRKSRALVKGGSRSPSRVTRSNF